MVECPPCQKPASFNLDQVLATFDATQGICNANSGRICR